MGDVFESANEALRLGLIVINQHAEHEHLKDLFKKGLIGFFFRMDDPAWAGKCKKASAFERDMTGKIFLIFINQTWWNLAEKGKQLALIDHELCHIGRKSDEPEYFQETKTYSRWNPAELPESWFLIEHDVEEFAGVIERHGLWDRGVERIADACAIHQRQMTLGEYMKQDEGQEADELDELEDDQVDQRQEHKEAV